MSSCERKEFMMSRNMLITKTNWLEHVSFAVTWLENVIKKILRNYTRVEALRAQGIRINHNHSHKCLRNISLSRKEFECL